MSVVAFALACAAALPQVIAASEALPAVGVPEAVAISVEPVGDDEIRQATFEVVVQDDAFSPSELRIPVGGIVRWTNVSSQVHTTTSDRGLWSWTLLPGTRYSVRFLTPGSYGYYCQYHPQVRGTIVVGQDQPPVTPGPSATPGETAVPGSGAIVYDAPVSGTITDLFTIEPDGTGKQQITRTGNLTEAQPRWSPDRLRIAFSAGQGPAPYYSWRIHVLDLTTNQTRVISNGPEHYEPAWSPDGSWIAYTEIVRSGNVVVGSAIGKVRPDGTGARRLVYLSGSSTGIGSPDWSPDGARIAFVVRSNASGGEIYQVDASGTQVARLLARSGWDDIDPQWSPDGRYLAFASGPARGALEGIEHDLWLADMTTGTTGTVARAPGWNLRRPAWSPDGSQLVFNGKYGTYPYGLYVVPSTGGTVAGPLDVGYEPDWASASLLPIVTPTPPPGTPTIPPFPTFPPPGPTATEGPPPTFPPPTEEPTPTEVPTEEPTPTATDTEEPTEEPTATPVVDGHGTLYLPWLANTYLRPETPTPWPGATVTPGGGGCLGEREVEPNNMTSEADARPALCDDRAVRGSLPATDPEDLFRVEVRFTGRLGGDLLLAGMREGTNCDLLLYREGSLDPIAASRNPGLEAEHVSADVTPGTYYVRVVPAAGSARSDDSYRVVVYRE